MCIINDKADVSSTKILVSPNAKGTRQLVVYSNKVATEIDKNAMILPIPSQNASDISLHDLSECPDFFENVSNVFDIPLSRKSYTNSAPLPVLSCGSYKVSIVPDIYSFSQLDSSVFVLEPTVGSLLAKYYSHGFSFLVCMLDLSSSKKKYHPIAYSHPIGDSLFVPTRHHHGFSNAEEVFSFYDHDIYGVNTQSPSSKKWLGTTPECFSSVPKWDFPIVENMTKNAVRGELRNMDYNLPFFKTNESKESNEGCFIA